MRRYINAAIALSLALVLLPISGLPNSDLVAGGLAMAFALYVGWLTVRLRRLSNSPSVLFGVASLSLAVFMLSVALGPQFGTGNWFFPTVSLVAGLITIGANVVLHMKGQSRGGA